jgi:hypothetical protein
MTEPFAEQGHERSFRRPAMGDENRRAGRGVLRLEDINRDVAVRRRHAELARISQEPARPANQKRMASFPSFGAVRFTKIAKCQIPCALR